MKHDRRFRLVEWGKDLLILLLFLSALYLLGRAQLSGRFMDKVQDLLAGNPLASSDADAAQPSAAAVQPVRLAIYQDGLRYGVEYDQEEVDKVFTSVSTLLSEALGSAAAPEMVSQQAWRSALCSTGIYLDFLYPVPLETLTRRLGDGQENAALTGQVRRMCLAADESDGVSLFYINEESGSYYACKTTLSRDFHLDAAVEDWPPNGAQFAFEVQGMGILAPYTMLTVTPQPAVYMAGNALLEETERVKRLLELLTFNSQSSALDPAKGGTLVEGNDSLRLSESGVLTYHAVGDSADRFPLPENSEQGALDYVQTLAEATAGAWCGQAQLRLASVEQTGAGWIITFQYCLDGAAVALPDGYSAARFVISNGAVTDFSLYLRSYTVTEETSVVLPAVLAVAAMEAIDVQGKELALLYQDLGGELVTAGWIAV